MTIDVRGKKVTVVGLGRTALALVRLLLSRGARPFVTDGGTGPALEAQGRVLDDLGVPWATGAYPDSAFAGAALVIPSPGVARRIPPIAAAAAAGTPVCSEMEFAFGHCGSRLIAVTGTNGKTTTTELLRSMVAACGRTVALAGNNERPFSQAVLETPAPEFIVLEVSSYQLEGVRDFRPWLAAVLNVTPDHLERHGTLAAYAGVKARLFGRQGPGDVAVLNGDDPVVRAMATADGARRRTFSLRERQPDGLWLDGETIRAGDEAVATAADVRLPGRHNLGNALAALTLALGGGFPREGVLSGLRGFDGVEHRIERVGCVGGVTFYNDSKSTNLDSLRVALESFDRRVVLIAGGRGKGSDYRSLRGLVAERVKALVLMGEDAQLMEEALGDLAPTWRATDMDVAVDQAIGAAGAAGIVLLSPACASFDMYANFEERGRAFKASVARHGVEARVL